MKYFRSAAVSAFVLICAYAQGQDNSVGINTNSPNANAVLELVSPNSDQGLLVPRMSTSQRTAMQSSLSNADDGRLFNDDSKNNCTGRVRARAAEKVRVPTELRNQIFDPRLERMQR